VSSGPEAATAPRAVRGTTAHPAPPQRSALSGRTRAAPPAEALPFG